MKATTSYQLLTRVQELAIEAGTFRIEVDPKGRYVARDNAGNLAVGRSPRLALEALEETT